MDVEQRSLTSLAFYMGNTRQPSVRRLLKREWEIMAKVFRITPKRIKRTNGAVLTPEMSVTVTTAIHTTNPFANGAKEIQEAYMRLYGFDYKKACCNPNDFDFIKLD